MRFATEVGAGARSRFSFFAGSCSVYDVHHFLLERASRVVLLNLNRVSSWPDTKDILVLVSHSGGDDFSVSDAVFNDVEGVVLLVPYSRSEAPRFLFGLTSPEPKKPSVLYNFSKASNCSVFHSLAVSSFTPA